MSMLRSPLSRRSLIWLIPAVLFATAACLPPVLHAQTATKSSPRIDTNVEIPMRDGVILRADVFRPDGEGPFPVLVHRTPYGKGKGHAKLAGQGFIIVSCDLRGRYGSGGSFESFNRAETHDAADGFDLIAWAAKMPGSSGRVGTLGVSYDAFVQWRAVGAQPPALGAFAAFSIPAKYTDLEMPGTVRPGRRWEWWFTQGADIRKKDGLPPPHSAVDAKKLWDEGAGKKILDTVPWLALPDEMFGHEAAAMKDWLRKPSVDAWKLDDEAARAQVPNLNICGWYDHCNGSIDLHTAIATRGATEAARKYSKLIVGPWSHVGLGQRVQGNVDFGPDAEVHLGNLMARWFTHWLKDDATADFAELPPVRLFVMGINRWRNFEQWPPAAKPQSWYLSGGGNANTPSGDGRLVADAPTTATSDSYAYDPRDPVPTQWTPGKSFTVAADQRPLAARQDILVYQTEPLDTAVETIGYPEVTLFAESDRPDADFFARLIDVAPDGAAIEVTHGMVRARHRESLERVTLLTPGETVEFQIKLRPTAHRFLPGHRVRLDVTSSDFPSYDRNHSTAADPNADAELASAKQTVRHGGKFASRLTLPTMAIAE
jgi:putative CocE/NonD family hydrolase